MKIFKMILNCVLPTLLVFSIVLNILLLCGFEFTKNTDKNYSPQQTQNVTVSSSSEDTDKEQFTLNCPTVQTPKVNPDKNNLTETLIYEDDNITVTYLTSTEDSDEIVHLFNIKNTSDKTLTVITSELYLNGQRVYISGLTCEKLLPNTDSDEELVLLNEEWKQVINYPSKISFKIKLLNDKSRLDLYETDLLTLEF
jgi:hypothetical protein